MNGVLLVDKPAGWTSHDVVAKVRSLLRQAQSHKPQAISHDQLMSSGLRLTTSSPKVKVGHAGTLDPAATGLLIVLVGSYTKKAAEFIKLDKTYEAELTLGSTSTTGDIEGKISQKNAKKSTEDEVEAVLKTFLGEIWQTPHPYSAIKVGGQRAYTLARAGKKLQLEPRQVTVHRLQVTGYKYPKLKIIAEVSSGTYIRSLAEDIGEKLGTGAYLSALCRTKVGDFDIKDAQEVDNLDLSEHL